jgi:predicted DNA-binding transcriptional regulator AlpA
MPKKIVFDANGLPTGGSTSSLQVLDQLKADMPTATYIRQAGLLPAVIPISPATLWRWVKNGQFPAPHRLSHQVTAWLIADVRQWIESKRVQSAA